MEYYVFCDDSGVFKPGAKEEPFFVASFLIVKDSDRLKLKNSLRKVIRNDRFLKKIKNKHNEIKSFELNKSKKFNQPGILKDKIKIFNSFLKKGAAVIGYIDNMKTGTISSSDKGIVFFKILSSIVEEAKEKKIINNNDKLTIFFDEFKFNCPMGRKQLLKSTANDIKKHYGINCVIYSKNSKRRLFIQIADVFANRARSLLIHPLSFNKEGELIKNIPGWQLVFFKT